MSRTDREPDLDGALERATAARDAIDDAMDAVGADKRESDAMWTLRAAYSAVEKARSAIQSDRQALDRWAERPDPELRWKDDRIERAEEQRSREEA